MTRLLLILGAIWGTAWVLLALNFLPSTLELMLARFVYGLPSLACPLFFLSLFVAPGLYHDVAYDLRRYWERFRTRRYEIEDLERKIAHLDRPYHMVQLGAIYARQGSSTKAVDWFRKALEKEPDSLDAQYRLALCNFELKEHGRACELLEKVHASKPDHDYGLAYLRLAQAHHQLGNVERASEVYATFLRYYPGQAEGSYQYALLLADQDNQDRARELMKQLIFTVRHSPAFQRRRNRHWVYKAHWWMWRNRK